MTGSLSYVDTKRFARRDILKAARDRNPDLGPIVLDLDDRGVFEFRDGEWRPCSEAVEWCDENLSSRWALRPVVYAVGGNGVEYAVLVGDFENGAEAALFTLRFPPGGLF